MGSGKSTLAQALGTRLGWPVSDSDEVILTRTGKTAAEHAAERGAHHIHQLESEHLLEALEMEGPTIVAAAASVVEIPECVTSLQRSDVVCLWLQMSPATLADCFTSGGHRPRYAPDLEAMFTAQAAKRNWSFDQLSKAKIDADGLTVDELVDWTLGIAERLGFEAHPTL